jgi:hypothetical protein
MTIIPQAPFSGETTPPTKDEEEISYWDEELEDDWILDLPKIDPNTLRENTDSWGPFYHWQGKAKPEQWPVSLAITREIIEPWHVGFGLLMRSYDFWNGSWTSSTAYGVWWRGRPPKILKNEPKRLRWRRVVNRSRRLS